MKPVKIPNRRRPERAFWFTDADPDRAAAKRRITQEFVTLNLMGPKHDTAQSFFHRPRI